MRILVLLPCYRPSGYHGNVGGGEISNRILFEGLSARGHDVSVVSIKGAGRPVIKMNGVVVYEAYRPPKDGFFSQIVAYFNFKKLSSHVMDIADPDVVISTTEAASVGVSLASRAKIPSGIIVRAFENFHDQHFTLSDKFRCSVKKLLMGDYGPKALLRADFLLPNSDFMQRRCEQVIGKKESHVIYPPLDLRFEGKTEGRTKVKVVSCVGTSEKKGCDVVRKLSARFPEINFRIVGDSRLQPEQEYRVGNITFVGWCDTSVEFQKNADVVIVPSLWEEPFGRVAVEGLAAGRVVLASNIGGLPEALDYQDLLLVKSGCEDAWSSRLSSLIDDPAPFIEASDRARRAASKYKASCQVDNLESVLQSKLMQADNRF